MPPLVAFRTEKKFQFARNSVETGFSTFWKGKEGRKDDIEVDTAIACESQK